MNYILLFIFSGIISGKVFNIDSNESLQAHIYLESLNQTFPCDSTGKFSFPHIPTGNYNIIISHVGFKEESLEVEIPGYGTIYLSIGLKQIPISIEPIEVKTEKPTGGGCQTIEYEEIKIIPGAEKDIFRVIQTLPGVSTPSDYLGLIYVRGGELYENQVFFDGVEILSPYHYFGIGSVFNIDLVENFEFYSGSFPARYGNAISSVLNIESKEPDNRIKGNVSADIMEANWLYNCPIAKNISFTFSSKRNYLDLLLNNLGIAKDVMLPYYVDHQGKILINSTLGKFTVSGLKSKEETSIESSFAEEILKIEIDGSGNSISTGWKKEFNNNINCQANIFYCNMNRYLYGEIPGPYGELEYSTEEFDIEKYGCVFHSQLNSDVIHFEIGGGFGKYAFMHTGAKIEDLFYGIDILEYSLDFDTTDNYGYVYSSQRFNVLKPFVCELGERIDWFPIIESPLFSPRIKFVYNRKPTIYIGYGHQHQLPPLEYEITEPKSSYAKCLNLGIEHSIRPALLGKIELYNKNYSNLVTEHYSDSLGIYFSNDGDGYASGVEISIRKYKIENYWGWVSYAYSISKRTSPYNLNFSISHGHRPHIFNFIFGVSPIRGIEIGFKFQLASGTAYSEVIGREWDASYYGRWVPVYAPDKTYLPVYQRFDIHLEKSFSLLEFDGAFYITILNLANHRNVQTYFYNSDITMRKTFYMIPRVPLIGFRLKF